jgi:cysteine-rich repeat protein
MARRHLGVSLRALLGALLVAAGACGGGDGAAPPVCGNGKVEAGEACDDGNDVPGDGCEPTCQPSCLSVEDCDDGFTCTVDTCDPLTGCAHAPDDTACDDGIACTTDACDPSSPDAAPGSGCRSTPVDAACDDDDACTVDTCVAGVGCDHSTLGTWYEDADGDGYGNPSVSVCAAAAPAGFVGMAGDCCDTSADAHPGQSSFFTTANACGDFDYDCSGFETKQYLAVASCSGAGGACGGNPGFLGGPAPCGATGTWQDSCYASSCGTLCWTCRTSTSSRTQGCR